mgnify:CR=1 FL=1
MFDKSSPIYESLVNLSQDTADIHLRDLLNKSRLESFCINGDLLSFDFSKQRITEEVLERLLLIPDLVNLKEAMHELDSGKKLNFSEDKKVSHILLRKQIFTKKQDIESKAILEERSKLSKFTSKITKMSGKEIKFIISIGIGGSRLGPELLSEAFSENKKLKMFYCSSYDRRRVWLIMRKHEINKRRKEKQKRRSSAKSQVSKKHKRKHKDKQAHRKWGVWLPQSANIIEKYLS